MEYLDMWYDHQTKFMSDFGQSDEQFKEALQERVVATVNDTPIVVWDDAVFAILQVSQEFSVGAAYHAEFKVILMNNKTWTMEESKRDAIIWHELGHKALGHETITQDQELEADKFSADHGHDMHSTLLAMKEELLRMFSQMGLPLEAIDAGMTPINERIAAVA